MELKLGEVFGSGMVLQRERPVAVWGTALPGSKVEVDLQKQHVSCTAGDDGSWSLMLQPLHTAYNQRMQVRCGGEEMVLEDVLVGEVWIAGGQSNMEFFLRYDKDRDEVLKTCTNPDIRFFDYPEIANEALRYGQDYSRFGFWRPCTPEHVDYYSAVAYYFASQLQKKLKVPVGIIGCNCGGTRSMCWMDEETLAQCGPEWKAQYEAGLAAIPDLEAAEQRYRNGPMAEKSDPFHHPFQDPMFRGPAEEELAEIFRQMDAAGGQVVGPWHEWRPCGLYHTMLEHIMPYTVRGVIWYQGESDEIIPHKYRDMMEGLIGLWRRKWNAELPFLMVQLAPYGMGEAYPALREQQLLVCETVKNVWLASSSDVGHPFDVHPKEKRPIGNRLAALALGHVYKENGLVLCDAPTAALNRASWCGSTVTVPMWGSMGGLRVNGSGVNGLQVLCDGQETACEAAAEGETLVIRLPEGLAAHTVTVKFCRTPYYCCNLVNMAGTAAMPFEISFTEQTREVPAAVFSGFNVVM